MLDSPLNRCSSCVQEFFLKSSFEIQKSKRNPCSQHPTRCKVGLYRVSRDLLGLPPDPWAFALTLIHPIDDAGQH